MPDALKGNLAQLPLVEVLKLLAAGGQTGRLDLRDGGTKGEIHLREGALVHAVAGSSMGEAAIHALMHWPRGDFDFFPNVAATDETIKTPTEQLLKEATQRAEEWKQIKSVISSTEAVFRLSPSGMVSATSLQPEEWRVLAHVNGASSIAEIATRLGEDELTVAKIMFRLAQAGLLEAGERPKGRPGATMGAEFFSKLNDEFVDIMGPIGPTIIDETIAALGETRESFPREKVAALVERMSADISATVKRVQFQQVMLEVLKKA